MTTHPGVDDMTTTSTDKTQRPEWAAQVLAALMEVGVSGTTREGEPVRLMRGELLMLDGIAFRLRGRLGELSSRGGDMSEMGSELLRAGMAEIAGPPAGQESQRPATRDGLRALLIATMGIVAFGVIATVAVGVGQYVQAALWGLMGAAFALLVATAPRTRRPRQPKAPDDRGSTEVTP